MARGDGRAVRILHVQHRQRDGRDQRGDQCGDHARPPMRSRQAPRPGDEANPFHGLDPIDFGAKFQRMIEDICDRSTSKLGPWWVPK